GDDALDDSGPVAHLEEVELAAGALAVKPSAQQDLASVEGGDVVDVHVRVHEDGGYHSPKAARGPPRRCGTAGATPRRASPKAARGPPQRCGTAGATPRRASPKAARGPPRRCGTAGATPRRASPKAARGLSRPSCHH